MLKLAGVIVHRRDLAGQHGVDAGPASGRIRYLPRPMNSERTFWVSCVSRLKTVVRFAKVGTPIVRMFAGRNDPRPASA